MFFNHYKKEKMKRLASIALITTLILITPMKSLLAQQSAPTKPLSELQLDLVNLRFGMFIHFNPCTYLEPPNQLQPDHAPPRQGKDGILGTADDLSPDLFNPVKLNCGQWADAAKSAGMKFGILTTKHHDGFCLWPSKYSTYTEAYGFKRDVVREFVDSFRSRGLKVGLYYSIRDRTEKIASEYYSKGDKTLKMDSTQGDVSRTKIELIKNELTELLTNYGDILYIVFDAWGNTWHESPTFYDITYAEIYNHIKSIQPNCLVLNHSNIRGVCDIPQIELNAKMGLPTGDDWPAVGGNTFHGKWFWRATFPTMPLRSLHWVVDENLIPFNKRNIVFQLNCPPNRDGLIDDNMVSRLAEVGKAWTPPAPLTTVPDSWKDWPTPQNVKLFKGENIAKGKVIRSSAKDKNAAVDLVVDGNPNTSVDLSGDSSWFEIDLGKVEPIAGIHIWNRALIAHALCEKGYVFISETPFVSNSIAEIQKQKGVKTIAINEPVSFPSPFVVKAKGRYIRLVSTSKNKLGIAELEVFRK